VISQVKLIAEPWDIGEGGYQVGQFAFMVEWNGKYRDCVRDYWRGRTKLSVSLPIDLRQLRSLRDDRKKALRQRQFCHRSRRFKLMISFLQ
jgi:hypothetical protein